ncbi:helicase associated domain-containing protein [Streptomyces triculaminicus]|uniref:helicase associated domain-containing protein n=1 Tax=Streptomyces triculaminicus TaxID=2816232 RepID=UPI0037D1699D
MAWRRGYAAARVYRSKHGHLLVPRTFKTGNGQHLGEWIHAQRRLRHDLSTEQIHRLDALGMIWTQPSPHEAAWNNGLSAARAFLAEHGHLNVPQKYINRDGFKLGTWINNQRTRRARLPADRIKALNALRMTW